MVVVGEEISPWRLFFWSMVISVYLVYFGLTSYILFYIFSLYCSIFVPSNLDEWLLCSLWYTHFLETRSYFPSWSRFSTSDLKIDVETNGSTRQKFFNTVERPGGSERQITLPHLGLLEIVPGQGWDFRILRCKFQDWDSVVLFRLYISDIRVNFPSVPIYSIWNLRKYIVLQKIKTLNRPIQSQ